jgi:hypothetical protein
LQNQAQQSCAGSGKCDPQRLPHLLSKTPPLFHAAEKQINQVNKSQSTINKKAGSLPGMFWLFHPSKNKKSVRNPCPATTNLKAVKDNKDGRHFGWKMIITE